MDRIEIQKNDFKKQDITQQISFTFDIVSCSCMLSF